MSNDDTSSENGSPETAADQTANNSSANQNTPSHHNSHGGAFDPSNLGILNDVSILLTIEIGRAQIKIRDLLNLTKDSIIDLNKLAGEPVDIYANGKLISKGNIITANGKYCVRLTTIPETNQF